MSEAAHIPNAEIEKPPLLSWDEICVRYPSQWIIVVDMEEKDYEVAAARVWAHGPDKKALLPAMREAASVFGELGRFHTGVPRRWKFV